MGPLCYAQPATVRDLLGAYRKIVICGGGGWNERVFPRHKAVAYVNSQEQ